MEVCPPHLESAADGQRAKKLLDVSPTLFSCPGTQLRATGKPGKPGNRAGTATQGPTRRIVGQRTAPNYA